MRHYRWFALALAYTLFAVGFVAAEDESVERDMEEEVLLYETFDMGSFKKSVLQGSLP